MPTTYRRAMYYIITAVILTTCAIHRAGAVDALCPNETLKAQCLVEAEEDWDIDRNKASTGERDHCCYQRQWYSCVMDLGKNCTGKNDRKNFNIAMTALKTNIDMECSKYPSDSCDRMAWWKILLIVVGTLLGVALVGWAIYACFFRRRKYSARKA